MKTRRVVMLETSPWCQPIRERPSADSTLLFKLCKTPHCILWDGSHSLNGIRPLWPPLPGKVIKATLFYFTQNSVSMVLFGTWWTEAVSTTLHIPLRVQRTGVWGLAWSPRPCRREGQGTDVKWTCASNLLFGYCPFTVRLCMYH